jgi:acetoin utilization deacetylase AcuC-like enzyme
LRAITTRLVKSGAAARCAQGDYQPLTEEEVAALHAPAVARLARRTAEQGGGRLDGDTPVSPESYTVALAAAGACASAVDAVMQGKDRNALCLIRPPGHHATPTHSMGFCLFNNIALAAQRARQAHGLKRIMIVDWDVHHGNGTQDIFYADPEVQFFSVHRYGHGFYPGSGAADETGTGAGLGRTLNLPLPLGVSRKQYLAAFSASLEKAADAIQPELILLSAGFDAHAADPIGALGLEVEDFADMTRLILDAARTHAGGRLVSCLEGGYNLEALAASVEAHLHELIAAP